jgi:type IV pilus assembly protein PilA
MQHLDPVSAGADIEDLSSFVTIEGEPPVIARIRKSMNEKDQGFTLIELLVVMIIIGILAAIAIPVFLNQRKKAQDTAATSDVSTLGKEVATYYVDATAVLAAADFSLKPYKIGTLSDIGNTSGNVTKASLSYGDATSLSKASTTWCVTVEYTGGTVDPGKTFYSAANGLSKTSC